MNNLILNDSKMFPTIGRNKLQAFGMIHCGSVTPSKKLKYFNWLESLFCGFNWLRSGLFLFCICMYKSNYNSGRMNT
jgi:hypothetical protein